MPRFKFRFVPISTSDNFVRKTTSDNITIASNNDRVPTSSGKPGKIGKVFPVREISGNL